jgi:DNA-binding transcriptional LysR family regulator
VQVFLVPASEGKLATAARRLGARHSTIVCGIKTLEDSIGTRLFDRLPDRFVLNAAG